MALTGFQRALLRVLARNRLPNSVFGGDGALNRGRARLDRDTLAVNGYQVEERRLAKGRPRARVGRRGRLPDRLDPGHGLALLPGHYRRGVRLARPRFRYVSDKMLVIAGRREPCDFHDVVALIGDSVPLSSRSRPWRRCGCPRCFPTARMLFWTHYTPSPGAQRGQVTPWRVAHAGNGCGDGDAIEQGANP